MILITVVLLVVGYLIYQFNPFPPGHKKPSRKPFERQEPVKFTGRAIPCYNPATGELLGEDISATPEEVNECILRASNAQKEWGATSYEERAAFLHDLIQVIVENQEEICKLSVTDTGKTLMEAFYGEILTSCEKLRSLIIHGKKAIQSEKRAVPNLLFLKKARVEYYPFGVIGIIIPSNYPFHNALSAVASAVLMGNAAVVKVSEWSTFCRAKYQELMQNALAKRGFNPDLIQLLPGYGDTGAALCKSPLVHKILFIGSPETGKRVMIAAAENLTPVILELGGKDAFIVLKDAELDHAVEVALRGVFVNQGQNCIAAERILVESEIYQEFCDKVAKIASKFRQGCPSCSIIQTADQFVDCGSMNMPIQVQKVTDLVQDALNHGAKALVGGHVREEFKGTRKLFFPPTILVDVTPDMRIVKEETFGPVMLIMKFSSNEEVVKLANDSAFGLGCSLFSRDYKRAELIGKQILSGMLTINDFGISYLIQTLPFGGIKMSGFGRFNGIEGLREFCRIKSVVTDRFPVRTKAPRFTSYPVPTKAPIAVSNAVIMLYSNKALNKVKAAVNLVKVLVTMDNPKL